MFCYCMRPEKVYEQQLKIKNTSNRSPVFSSFTPSFGEMSLYDLNNCPWLLHFRFLLTSALLSCSELGVHVHACVCECVVVFACCKYTVHVIL